MTFGTGTSTSSKRLGSIHIDTLRGSNNRLWEQMEWVGEWLDARPLLLIVVLLLAYVSVTIPHSYFRPMWHDELITYNLALSPSVAQVLRDSQRIDLNPPVLYLLDYVALRLPGAHVNEHFACLAARLPSLLAGLLASVGLFVLVRQRLGSLYGLATVGVFWNTEFLTYVWEDRPYALVCGFLVLLMLLWERATGAARHRFVWVAATFLVGLAMMSSHLFASFLLAAFLLAELARAWTRRRLDLPLLAAFTLPLSIPIAYKHLISGYGRAAFPALFQPSIATLGKVYVSLADSWTYLLAPTLILCLVATVRMPEGVPERHMTPTLTCASLTFPEWILVLAIIVEPVLAVLSIMRTQGAFFERYGLPACVSIAVLLVVFLYWRFNRLKRVALILVMASFVGPLSQFAQGAFKYLSIHDSHVTSTISTRTDYRAIHPELPFVDASALTFVEMNHRESPEMLRRTYYLTDRSRALRYKHASMWESETDVSRILHFKATVQDLPSFEATHSHFLVLGTYASGEDWLLQSLVAEGETVRYLGSFDTGYKDRDLYEVTIDTKP